MPLSRRRLLLAAAVVVVTLNLRAAVAAVSPVLDDIRADLGLSGAAAGLLTTLPVLCFAATAPFAAYLGRRWGINLALYVGLGGIVLGSALRGVGGVPALVLGTLLIGVAITVGNVLLPVVVKRDFPGHVGAMTGVFAAALSGGAGIAAATTAPLSHDAGWRFGLAFWLLPAAVAIGAWWIATRSPPRTATGVTLASGNGSATVLRRSRVAWAVTLFFGSQSALYYSVTAWLPTILNDTADLSAASAGVAMSLFQLVGIASAIVAPRIAARSRSQTATSLVVAAIWAASILGLLLLPDAWLMWSILAGLAQGAGISLAFMHIAMRSHDAAVARTLSGMVQGFGYVIGAAGPLLVGMVFDLWSSWQPALVLLLALAGLLALASVDAGRPVTVGRAPSAVD
jgi:CP family cyanate transporter-like MFS transporter